MQIVNLLLQNGAHVDLMDKPRSPSPLKRLQRISNFTIYPLRHISLKCLAARAVQEGPAKYRQHAPRLLPRELTAFLRRH